MPKFTIKARGGLRTSRGLVATGGVVDMSEKDAASLPFGTVEAVPVEKIPEAPKAPKSEAKASKEKLP